MKKSLMSIMIVSVAMLMVGSASFAYFEDTETITGNSLLAGDIDLQLATLGQCEMVISFLEEDATNGQMLGVTDDTSGWSHGDGTVNLGVQHINLDLGDAYAYENGATDIFSHRGTRGLGCYGAENDEVDCVDNTERIEIKFDKPQFINGFEIRSLFNHDTENFGEVADVDLYLGGILKKEYDLVGIETLGGNDGDVKVDIDPEILIDKIVFYVDDTKDWSERSEFAVARIWLAPLECNEDDVQLGAIWKMDDVKPGQETSGRIWFCDVGSNYGGTLHITCDYTVEDPFDEESDTQYPTGDETLNPGSTNAFASYMQITELKYYCADDNTLTTLTVPEGTNANGWADCQDLKETTLSQPLGSNGANGDYLFMEIKFHENAGNEFQGDVFNLEMYFTLEQIMYGP